MVTEVGTEWRPSATTSIDSCPKVAGRGRLYWSQLPAWGPSPGLHTVASLPSSVDEARSSMAPGSRPDEYAATTPGTGRAQQLVDDVVGDERRDLGRAAHREAPGRGQREEPGHVDLGIGAGRHRGGAFAVHDEREAVRGRRRPRRAQQVLGEPHDLLHLLPGDAHLGEAHPRLPVVGGQRPRCWWRRS